MKPAPWRTGRKLGRTLYVRKYTNAPSDDDPFVGIMDTPGDADRVVNAVNTLPEALDVLDSLVYVYGRDTKSSIQENHPDLAERVGELLGCPECGDKPSTHCDYCHACPCDCGGTDE